MSSGEIVDLCAGYGGLSMGLSAVTGAQVTAYAEVEPAALAILRRHHPDAADLGDVKTLDWRRVAGARWFCAGYPCQPFSDAGKRLGADDPRHLWPWIAAGIATARPDFVLLENVEGHVRRGLGVVLQDLTNAGYGGAWGVVTADAVGAPHRRRRVFVLACGHVAFGFRRVQFPAHRLDILPAGAALLPTLEAKLGSSGPDFARAARKGSGGDDLTTAVAKVLRGMVPADRYAAAVRRWERITGTTAPTMGKPNADRVAPIFAEWMMGLPVGHVTGHGLTAEAELVALGNGVVPLQASYAVGVLMRTLSQLPRTLRGSDVIPGPRRPANPLRTVHS